MKVPFLARLWGTLSRYAHEVQRSRAELSESTQEQALPPIPPGDHHGKKNRRSTR
jgi:hypothetical protein